MSSNSGSRDGVKFDPFWMVQLGDLVQAVAEVPDEDIVIAIRGDLGRCVEKPDGFPPVIHWERTGRMLSCIPGDEFEVLAEEAFASSKDTTPDVTRRAFLHRRRMYLAVSNPTPSPIAKKERP